MLWVLWGLALLLPHLPLSRAASRGLWLGFRPHGAHAPICISDLGGGYTEVYPARPYLAYTSPTRLRGIGAVSVTDDVALGLAVALAPRVAASRGARGS